jgi:glycosyltransferase involved in cell wall biosynthesis
MDGGSSDRTVNILEKYNTWISFWQSKKDRGQGQAINMGFSIAGGDYYGWLNSDDFYNENALLVLANEIRASGKGFYYGDALSIHLDRTDARYWQGYWVSDAFLRFGGLIASHSAFWKNTIHQPVWEAMNCNVDAELWIRLVKNQSRKHIRFPIGTIRFHDNTKSANSKWRDRWKEDDLNIERLHGPPPAPRSLKTMLFRFIQKIYKKTSQPIPGWHSGENPEKNPSR